MDTSSQTSQALDFRNYKKGNDWLPMVGSEATGLALVKSGSFAADMLHFLPRQKTELHTHPGSHILFVVEGEGWLIFGGQRIKLSPGDCYLVPGSVLHAVGSGESGMFLLSVANEHFPVDSSERLTIYAPVLPLR